MSTVNKFEMVDVPLRMPRWVWDRMQALQWRAGAVTLEQLWMAMIATYDLSLRCEEDGGTVFLTRPQAEGDVVADQLIVSVRDKETGVQSETAESGGVLISIRERFETPPLSSEEAPAPESPAALPSDE